MNQTGRARGALAVGTEAWQRAQAVDGVLAAAGVAFFALLSIVPAFGALIAIYGLFADPRDVAREVADLFGSDAGPGQQWVIEQLVRITNTSTGSLGLAAVIAILLALWSASSGVRHLLDAVDAAFGLPRATLVRARARGLIGVFVIVIVAAVTIGLLGAAPCRPAAVTWLRYPVVIAVVLVGCAVLYRPGGASGFTPPGAVVATTIWVLGSIGLVAYVSWGPDLQAAYGAFGSVVMVMLWLWICGIAVLAGAHVTAVLTSRRTGPASPTPA